MQGKSTKAKAVQVSKSESQHHQEGGERNKEKKLMTSVIIEGKFKNRVMYLPWLLDKLKVLQLYVMQLENNNFRDCYYNAIDITRF